MSVFSWVVGTFMTAFVFILIPYVVIGASSGFILGQTRGAMSGISALWCAILGPVGWLLTIFLTSDARQKVADADFAGIAEDVKSIVPRASKSRRKSGNDQEIVDDLGFDPSELD